MAVRQVLRMGHPTLLKVAQPVTEFNTAELDQLVVDMFDTMAEQTGVGLAAPQIGENLRIVTLGFEHSDRYPDAEPIPMTVLINPVVEHLDVELQAGWEGCLSVPGMRGLVPRYTRIRYHGFDQAGNVIDRVVKDFHARVVQHEVDHLDGILYPQKVEDMHQFGFIEELELRKKLV